MLEEVVYVVRYQVTSDDHRIPSSLFDGIDEATAHAARLLRGGNHGVHMYRYETRKSALEREEASPRTGTAA